MLAADQRTVKHCCVDARGLPVPLPFPQLGSPQRTSRTANVDRSVGESLPILTRLASSSNASSSYIRDIACKFSGEICLLYHRRHMWYWINGLGTAAYERLGKRTENTCWRVFSPSSVQSSHSIWAKLPRCRMAPRASKPCSQGLVDIRQGRPL